MQPARRGRSARRASMLCAAAFCVACAQGDDDRLVVFAASSLADVFDVLEAEYEARYPDVDVVVSFGGSSSLAAQIEQGAPADVFAAADDVTMAAVLAEAPGDSVIFARNRLVIAVERGNPTGVTSLGDLDDDGRLVVIAAPEVPAGAYAAAALASAGVELAPASFEQSVRAVAAKVALGEADAGIVYLTDVLADADRLDLVDIGATVAASYPIVALDDGVHARQFVDLVTSAVGAEALTTAGFVVP